MRKPRRGDRRPRSQGGSKTRFAVGGAAVRRSALHVGTAAALGCAAWLAVRGGRSGVLSKLEAALPWLVVACAGLLPLMVSARQFEHYLLPALLSLAIAVAVVRFGDMSRHRQYMDDAAAAQAIALGRSVGFCADVDRDRLSAYLFRNQDVLTRLGSGASRATHAVCNAALEGRAPLLRLRDGSTLWRADAPSGLES